MAEERKRYCLVLDRTSIVAKSTMEFCEHVSIQTTPLGGFRSTTFKLHTGIIQLSLTLFFTLRIFE